MTQFRSEIQALRAVAVTLVVLFHLWPDRLTGGYVGVDIFFVISGYLITGHLLRENASGGIRLPAFWARRIRRLLPAASLVLAVSALATVLFLPSRLWQATAIQIGASATGTQNWVLAGTAVDYFGANDQASLVQHYWSLSLEEQFYLVWPVLLFAAFAIARRTSPAVGRRVIAGAMLAVFSLSLAWSVFATGANQVTAYYSTFTHGWEFAAGGLLALFTGALTRSRWATLPRLRAVSTWVGFAIIVACAVIFTGASPFPGWIALIPVAGTLLVIAAGESTSRIQSPLFIKSRAVQWVGDSSYSTYLWHWPMIVVVPHVLGHPMGLTPKILILVASYLLGWLTKKVVEDPARTSRLLNHRTWVNYAIVGTSALLLVGASTGVWTAGAAAAVADQAAAQQAIDTALGNGNPCFGAAAMTDPAACPESHTVNPKFGPDFAANDWGTIAGVTKDGTLPDKSACSDFSATGAGFLDCSLGAANGAKTIAIVGDSHALALIEPLVRIAESQGWSVRAFLLNSCTPSLPMAYGPGVKVECNAWRQAVSDRIAADRTISLVITTGFTRGEPEAAFTGTKSELVDGYANLWAGWAASGKRVYVIEDVPLSNGQSVPECVAAHLRDADPCAVDRATSLAFDPVVPAVAQLASPNVSLIDLTPAFCDDNACHAVIGGLIAYRDPHHLSATFALTLIPRLKAGLGVD